MNTNNLVTIKTDGVQHHAKFTAAGQCYVYYDEMNNEVWSYSANIFADGKPYEYLFISGSSCDDLRSIYVKDDDDKLIPFVESKFCNKSFIANWGYNVNYVCLDVRFRQSGNALKTVIYFCFCIILKRHVKHDDNISCINHINYNDIDIHLTFHSW